MPTERPDAEAVARQCCKAISDGHVPGDCDLCKLALPIIRRALSAAEKAGRKAGLDEACETIQKVTGTAGMGYVVGYGPSRRLIAKIRALVARESTASPAERSDIANGRDDERT